MYSSKKAATNKMTSAATPGSTKHSETNTSYLQDNRPSSADQKKQAEPSKGKNVIQKKSSNTGLPDNLKSGIENLSGYSMDDVKVHYNSNKPAQLSAHAYAQGTDIHIASGQEKHLAHEAWHIVQQKQGRVKPTLQLKGKVNVNDDAQLEKEADVMGAKALQYKTNSNHFSLQRRPNVSSLSFQLKLDFNKYKLLEAEIGTIKDSAEKIFGLWNAKKISNDVYFERINGCILQINAISDKHADDFTLERQLRTKANVAIAEIRSHYLVADISPAATPLADSGPAIGTSKPVVTPYKSTKPPTPLMSDVTGVKFRQLKADIADSLTKAKFIYEQWIHHKFSLGEYLDKIIDLRNSVLGIPGKVSDATAYHALLLKRAHEVAGEINQYISHREDLDMINRLLDNPRFPAKGRQIIYRTHLPEEAIEALGTSLGKIEEWLLLHENVGKKDEFGTRFDIMEAIASVLMPFRERVKSIIPQARIKYRGSLVRGLKGYPKGGAKVDTKAYDCDAFIEVPTEFWLDMRTKGAKGIERDAEGNPTGGKIDIRGYEPLKQISFAPRDNPEQLKYRIIIGKLLEIEAQARAAMEKAQKSGKLKGYKYGETGIDFEFFIRAVYNSTTTYHEGNPYLKGQVSERGYPELEKHLGMSAVPEFSKKKDAPDKRELLGPYVDKHGAKGVIMPEYQAVIGKHGWYLETEELMEWRLLKRQLDGFLKERTKYSRTKLPQYTAHVLPAFNSSYDPKVKSTVATDNHELYDLIAVPEVIHFSIELKNLNTMMSSIKLFDAQTNMLTISKPELIPVIIGKYNLLHAEFSELLAKYQSLAGTPIYNEWFDLIERTYKKIGEAKELMAIGGSKKITRDHSKERQK
jgi:hypothetical protein